MYISKVLWMIPFLVIKEWQFCKICLKKGTVAIKHFSCNKEKLNNGHFITLSNWNSCNFFNFRLEDKVDKMEFTIGSIVTKIDAVLSKMDSLDTQNGLQPLKNDDDDDDDD